MSQDLFRLTASAYLPRLLIAENKFARVEPLLRTFRDHRLDLDFEVCTSVPIAIQKLSAFPYHVIISGAHLAEMNDFLLLQRTQTLDTVVPLVVTASASESETARRVLGRGAFDLISIPPNPVQTVRTIRLALWHSKLRHLIARKEQVVEQYRRHVGDYPEDKKQVEESFNGALEAFEKTIASVERTILRMEESTLCFSDFATKLEHLARQRALERLDSLPDINPTG